MPANVILPIIVDNLTCAFSQPVMNRHAPGGAMTLQIVADHTVQRALELLKRAPLGFAESRLRFTSFLDLDV